MLKCTVNGVEVEVKEGTNVIEAFKLSGQNIAHYCWHPGLSVAGVCRLCMVKIDDNPRLQVGCNTLVKDGMKITNQSEDVKDTVEWGLNFHLINHPLDCPICDQAGECGLQNQYMEFGKYQPNMGENKVKKRKVVDLGSKIVLDSERCILCSRCVRFTDEVTKTNELGIFNRGDRSEVGTFVDKPLENDYAVNTVDICPVGALTSKDFRFRQRVWYLKDAESVCTGCSTGCNVKLYYNDKGFYRVKPVPNEDVNGYWMCDKGRETYKFVNKEHRLHKAICEQKEMSSLETATELSREFEAMDFSETALVVTGQYSNEEYASFFSYFKSKGLNKVYHWMNNSETKDDFDGLLIRGDKNPNTKGLEEQISQSGLSFSKWDELSKGLGSTFKKLIVLAPENQTVYPDLEDRVSEFSEASEVFWFSPVKTDSLDVLKTKVWQLPVKSYVEKSGSFTNFEGRVQNFKRINSIVPEALSLTDWTTLFSGQKVNLTVDYKKAVKDNHFSSKQGGPV